MELRGKAADHTIDPDIGKAYHALKDRPADPSRMIKPGFEPGPRPGDSDVYVGSGDPDRPARRISEVRLLAGLVVATIIGLAGGMVVGILASPATWGRC